MHKIFVLHKFYFMPLHISSTCAHHQEVKIALHSLWYHHAYRWPSHAEHSSGIVTPIGGLLVLRLRQNWLEYIPFYRTIQNPTPLGNPHTSHDVPQRDTTHVINKSNLVRNFFSMFISFLYMFRANMCPSSGETTVFMAETCRGNK